MRYNRLWIIKICLVFLLLPVNACIAAQTRQKGTESFESKGPKEATRPFEIKDYTEVLTQLLDRWVLCF